MTGKTLHPQTAEYYKRLILVSDRFLLMLKERNKYRILMWLFAAVALAEGIFIAMKLLTPVNG